MVGIMIREGANDTGNQTGFVGGAEASASGEALEQDYNSRLGR